MDFLREDILEWAGVQRTEAKVDVGGAALEDEPERKIRGLDDIGAEHHAIGVVHGGGGETIARIGAEAEGVRSGFVIAEIEAVLDAGAIGDMMNEDARAAKRINGGDDAGVLRQLRNENFGLLFESVGFRGVLIVQRKICERNSSSESRKEGALAEIGEGGTGENGQRKGET